MSEQEFETVWTGASWREIPQPAPEAPRVLRTPSKPTTIHARKLLCEANREKVRAAFTEDYQTANQLAARVGVTVQAVRRHLREAIEDGVAEYQVVKSKRSWGRSERHFRRVTTRREAAA